MTLDLLSDGTLALSQRTHVVPKCGRIFVQCGASRCSFGEAEEIATHWAESTLREKRTAADGQCQPSPAFASVHVLAWMVPRNAWSVVFSPQA